MLVHKSPRACGQTVCQLSVCTHIPLNSSNWSAYHQGRLKVQAGKILVKDLNKTFLVLIVLGFEQKNLKNKILVLIVLDLQEKKMSNS